MSKELPSRELAASILLRYFNIQASGNDSLVQVEQKLADATKYADIYAYEFDSFVAEMKQLWRFLIQDYLHTPTTVIKFLGSKSKIERALDMQSALRDSLELAQKHRKAKYNEGI